jgi:hypothetical protein
MAIEPVLKQLNWKGGIRQMRGTSVTTGWTGGLRARSAYQANADEY